MPHVVCNVNGRVGGMRGAEDAGDSASRACGEVVKIRVRDGIWGGNVGGLDF